MCKERGAKVYLSAIDPKSHFWFGHILQGSWKRRGTSVRGSPECSIHGTHPATGGRGSCTSNVKARNLTLLLRYNQELAFSKKEMLNTRECV